MTKAVDVTAQQLSKLLTGALHKRRAMIEMQRALEKAWQSAAKASLALNRPMDGENIPQGVHKKSLMEAIAKKRAVESLQQKAFLIFHTLTENKYEGHLGLCSELQKKAQEAPHGDSLKQLAEQVGEFLDKEDRANECFLQNVEETRSRVDGLKSDLKATASLPCSDRVLAQLLNQDILLLENFMNTTLEILD